MATKTVTIDTNEWVYIDSRGDEHKVTNAETFTFTLTDGGASAVTYNVNEGQSVATDDGYNIVIDSPSKVNTTDIGTFADANDATEYTGGVRGIIRMTCDSTNAPQYWSIAKVTINNVDAPTAITKLVLEDQFGHEMVLPSTGEGWTVA